MADYSFTVSQHPDSTMPDNAGSFFFEMREAGGEQRVLLCEVRKSDTHDEFDILLWKSSKLILNVESIPRETMRDFIESISRVL